MKPWWKWAALSLCLFMGMVMLTGCGADNQERYERGQLYLGLDDYQTAMEIFDSLGGYADSEQYVLYCQGLEALEKQELKQAYMDFSNLGGFKQSDLYVQYLSGRILESEGRLEEAGEAFEQLGSFLDSRTRKAAVTARIPQRDYAAAKTLMDIGQYEKAAEAFDALGDYQDCQSLSAACRSAVFQKQVAEAQALCQAGDYQKALEAFDALDSSELSQADRNTLERRREACCQELYKLAESSAREGIGAAAETMTLYDSLEGYKDSAKKKEALEKKYGLNLSLHGYENGWQYVRLGAYPQTEKGESQPVLWRVLSVSDGKALLLSDLILDVMPMTQAGEWLQAFPGAALTKEAAGACANREGKPEAFLMTLKDVKSEALGFTGNESRLAGGTAYAQGKELRTAGSSSGWWWLSDIGKSEDTFAIVYYNGVPYEQGVPESDLRTGVRPALVIDLEKYAFTKGKGTREDPFT